MGTKEIFTFHSSASVAGAGNAYHIINSNPFTTAYVSISNTSGSRTINFEGKGLSSASYISVYCANVSGSTQATTISGASDEVWYANIAGLDYFRCNLTLASGPCTVIGKIVE